MVNDREDNDWIEGYKNGDKGCFDKLVNKYKNAICGFCYSKLENNADANDVAQETFIYANIAKFKGNSTFKTYLYTIAKYRCWKFLKKKNKEGTYIIGSIDKPIDTEDGEITKEYPDPNPNPREKAIIRERNKKIWKALFSMSAYNRELLIVIDMNGFTFKEASKHFGESVGTVWTHLHLARLELKKKLEEGGK